MSATNKGAYQTKLPNNIHTSLLYSHRMYAGPLDDTQVWNTLADLQEYIKMPGTYAYPGQVVTVANGTVDTTNGQKDYDTYIIRSDMSLQKVSGTKRFESLEAANTALPNLGIGDMVLVWDNAKKKHTQYSVDETTDGQKKLSKLSFDASTDLTELSWANLKDKPTSPVADIDASVTLSKKFKEPGAEETDVNIKFNDKELAYKENIPTTYDATKITGVIKPENLPKGAFDILHTVDNADALKTLTTEQVQNGDTVFVNDTKAMYFVKDETKLGNETDYMQAFQEYNAGVASSVDWSGVKNKPTTVDGYGITDAVKTTDVADVVTANKIVKANADGKIEGDITGDAGSVGGKTLNDLVQKTDVLTREQLPPDVSGDCVKVANQEERFKLVNTAAPAARAGDGPTEEGGGGDGGAGEPGTGTPTPTPTVPAKVVHKGFLVYQEDTKEVFCVVDDSKLTTEDGYIKISTSSIDWANINGKPTSTVEQIDQAVKDATHTNRATLDMFAESGEHTDQKKRPKFNNEDMALLADCKQAALNLLPLVDAEPESGNEGEFCLVKIKDV